MEPEPADAASALDEIDTSPLDTLDVVRGEEETVRELIQKATDRKDKVAAGVYSRVMSDYEVRLKGLDERARPLREQARGELAKLTHLHGRLKSVLEAAVLAQEEIEFRHELGELKEEEFNERGEKAKAEVASCQTAFDRAEALRHRFLDLLPPEKEPAPPPSRSGTLSGSKAQRRSLAEAASATGSLASPPSSVIRASKKAAAAAPKEEEPEGKTVFASRDSMVKDLAQEKDEDYRTMVVSRPARLVGDKDGEQGATYSLGMSVAVGRTPDNQIALETPDVSRHHAKIEAQPDGSYVVSDLGSGNGTFVNGKKIKEQALEEGDKVRFGNHSFVFHKS